MTDDKSVAQLRPDESRPEQPRSEEPRSEEPGSEQPRSEQPREIGPEALKAFAHPLRMAMYAELQRRGSATASGLARALGESSGQTSYHLRQLARHGFVEDAPGDGGGRERWWRAVGFDMSSPELLSDPATEPAARAVLHQVVADRAAALTAWASSIRADSAAVGMVAASTVDLLPEELDALAEALKAVLEAHLERVRGRERPPGALRTRIHLDVFPLPGDPGVDGQGPADPAAVG